MAMLAEPRRRKKYNLCPRGKALYEDDSRFGTKMLEKMGWSKGRGLGANEDGSQDFVRIRFKNDAEGLGYETRDDQWTTHEEGFNGLLKSLNGGHEDDDVVGKTNGNDSASEEETRPMGFGFKAPPVEDVKPKTLKEKISGVSLEEKSKFSKARVHYKKFTRGKDLSQYSEKDLANIFGKKATDDLNASVVESPSEFVEEEEKPIDPNFAGVQTVSTGLSVSDYFRQKMEAMKNKLKQNAPENPVEQPTSMTSNDCEEPVKKKKKKNKELERDYNVVAEPVEETVSRPKKNKESKQEAEEDATEIQQKSQDSQETTSQKRKKKKKNTEKEIEEVRRESPNEEDEVESNSQKRKKKKKDTQNEIEVELKESLNVETKKKRKSEAAAELEKSNSTSEEIDPPKRKKKKNKDEQTEDVKTTQAVEPEETNPTKRKKKKKNIREETQDEQISAEEPAECDTQNIKSNIITEDIEKQQLKSDKTAKKKNKKSKKETKELVDEPEAAVEIQDKESKESTAKKLKKSKKDKPDVSASESDSQADQEHEKFLSAKELISTLDSYDIFTISSFCAEKFHMLEMSAFKNSTLSQIIGYGVTDDIKLKIVEKREDATRIINLWEGKNNKYAQQKEPAKIAIRKTKKQITKQIKRKAFVGI